jgi:hypothetical protein
MQVEEVLMKLINKRNEAFKVYVKRPPEENQLSLKEAHHTLLKEKCKAKRDWQCTFAKQGQNHNFKENPTEARNMFFKLMDGFQSHHKTFIPKKLKKKMAWKQK